MLVTILRHTTISDLPYRRGALDAMTRRGDGAARLECRVEAGQPWRDFVPAAETRAQDLAEVQRLSANRNMSQHATFERVADEQAAQTKAPDSIAARRSIVQRRATRVGSVA